MVRIHIFVADVNDNAPEFQGAPRLVHVTAPVHVGSIIAEFYARDKDAGQNGLIAYSLREWVLDLAASGPSSALMGPTARARLRDPNGSPPLTDTTGLLPFAITNNGALVVTRRLNGEQADYWLEVAARDNGEPPVTTHHRALIQVLPSPSGLF